MRSNEIEREITEGASIEEDALLSAAAARNSARVRRPISGLYGRSSPAVVPSPAGAAEDLSVFPFASVETGSREELRIDVDGTNPQNVASGVIARALNSRVSWIAKLAPSGRNKWTGTIWFKDGDLGSFPYTNVKIEVIRSGSLEPQNANVIFSGGGAPNATRTFNYQSPHFRTVNFEFDAAVSVTPVPQIGTHNHPNHPADLPNETLTIPRVFQRAGFDVTVSGAGIVPVFGAGADALWSDLEMHDAMQIHWSRFANRPEWALWIFTASLHEEGTGLGGIMFDDIGPNHRQGTACFNDSFIKESPPGDPAPAAWVERMRFWCTCHEMGHAFNLAHSWQKSRGTPWIPLANQPEARSFMNYPFRVTGGQTAYFRNFYYRFSNDELLFMRHAPERFVQMGNADWFDHHAFRQANVLAEPSFELKLRGHQDRPFEFLEPVVLELKLTNVSSQPQLVDKKVLSVGEQLTVIVKKKSEPAREIIPFAQYCWQRDLRALAPQESIYESLFASVGQGGWDIAEPGYYTVQVALHLQSEDVVSNPLTIRVLPPMERDEEVLAQDFFSEDVGRILTFDGSRVLESANTAVLEVTDRLPDHSVAIHTRIAQVNAAMQDYKALEPNEGSSGDQAAPASKITMKPAAVDAGKNLLSQLMAKPDETMRSLGHIDFNYYVRRFSRLLAEKGDAREAATLLHSARNLLGKLNPPVGVLAELDQQLSAIADGDTRAPEAPLPKKKKS